MEDTVGSRSGGQVRVRPGVRARPPRDPRPWRRARAQMNATAATRADVAEMRMPHYTALPEDPRDRYAFPQEFPDGPYGMAPDRPPDGLALVAGQRAIDRESDAFRFAPSRYDRDYGPLTGTIADEPPPEPPGTAAAGAGDEPSD